MYKMAPVDAEEISKKTSCLTSGGGSFSIKVIGPIEAPDYPGLYYWIRDNKEEILFVVKEKLHPNLFAIMPQVQEAMEKDNEASSPSSMTMAEQGGKGDE